MGVDDVDGVDYVDSGASYVVQEKTKDEMSSLD